MQEDEPLAQRVCTLASWQDGDAVPYDRVEYPTGRVLVADAARSALRQHDGTESAHRADPHARSLQRDVSLLDDVISDRREHVLLVERGTQQNETVGALCAGLRSDDPLGRRESRMCGHPRAAAVAQHER